MRRKTADAGGRPIPKLQEKKDREVDKDESSYPLASSKASVLLGPLVPSHLFRWNEEREKQRRKLSMTLERLFASLKPCLLKKIDFQTPKETLRSRR